MGKTLVIPLQLSPSGGFAVTEDPVQVVRQRILDNLVTSRYERVHRSTYGCDLMSFLFVNPIDHLLGTKSEEIKSKCNAALTFGEVVQVQMQSLQGASSAVQVSVLFRVFEGAEAESLTETFTGLPEEPS